MSKNVISGLILVVTTLATGQTPALAVVPPDHAFDCDLPEQSRRVSTVSSQALVGSGAYTVAIERENSQTHLESPAIGTPVEIVRCLPPGRMVQLATGKIARVENAHYLASVYVPSKVATADHAVLTRSLVLNRNLYWQPMEGDYVRILSPQIAQRQRAWPRFEFSLGEIFETRPGDDSQQLSLKPEGRERLVNAFEQMESFGGQFLVEASSAEIGATAKVQELTQMRAGLVANFLSRVFELPSERIVARGLGRLEPSQENLSTTITGSGEPLISGKLYLRVLPGQ